MIQQIEQFCPELEFGALPDGELFEYRIIHIPDARCAKLIPAFPPTPMSALSTPLKIVIGTPDCAVNM